MSDLDLLATVPLLHGLPEPELEALAQVMRRREVDDGEVLWREGDEATGMLVVLDGLVVVSLQLPGGGTVEVNRMGPGEVLGEIPLLDGGRHSATARAAEPTVLLALSRTEFSGLVSRHDRTALALKRRIASLTCTRLRRQFESLAASLAEEGPQGELPPPAELEPSPPPDSAYVRRLAAFRAVEPLALWGLLTAGRYARCGPARTLVEEGVVSDSCYLTINGAVEKVIVRGGRRIRVGLAGPGQAFGYEGLIDGLPSPVTCATKERALVLMLPRKPFDRLFGGDTAASHVFIDVINRDLTAALRQVLRPHARLASAL